MPDSGSFIWLCFRYVTTEGSFMADVKLYSCYDVRIVLRGGIVGECVHK